MTEYRDKYIMSKVLPHGEYEYKYIVGGVWICNDSEPTRFNQFNLNNYIIVN